MNEEESKLNELEKILEEYADSEDSEKSDINNFSCNVMLETRKGTNKSNKSYEGGSINKNEKKRIGFSLPNDINKKKKKKYLCQEKMMQYYYNVDNLNF